MLTTGLAPNNSFKPMPLSLIDIEVSMLRGMHHAKLHWRQSMQRLVRVHDVVLLPPVVE